MGEGPSEEKLFSLKNNSMRENIGSELEHYILKLKVWFIFSSLLDQCLQDYDLCFSFIFNILLAMWEGWSEGRLWSEE